MNRNSAGPMHTHLLALILLLLGTAAPVCNAAAPALDVDLLLRVRRCVLLESSS